MSSMAFTQRRFFMQHLVTNDFNVEASQQHAPSRPLFVFGSQVQRSSPEDDIHSQLLGL